MVIKSTFPSVLLMNPHLDMGSFYPVTFDVYKSYGLNVKTFQLPFLSQISIFFEQLLFHTLLFMLQDLMSTNQRQCGKNLITTITSP